MVGRWQISMAHQDIVLVVRSAAPPVNGKRIAAAAAAWSVYEWLPHAVDGLAVARAFGDTVTSVTLPSVGQWADLRAEIAEALRAERLVAYALDPKLSGASVVEPVDPPKPVEPPKKEDLTWISIELVDDESEPVAGAKYRIELPDFSTREGRTDTKGKAKITDVVPGTCKVCFPEMDQDAWESA